MTNTWKIVACLRISAARDFEEAKEKEYNGQWHGNFIYSLIEVLSSPNAKNLSAARIFDKVVVQMKSHKASHEPVMVGSVARRQKTLFGEPVDPDKRPEVNVASVDASGKIILQGGRALGFHENCEFIRKGNGPEVRIRISEEPDYIKSVAEIVGKDPAEAKRIAATIKPNDTFVLDKWAIVGKPDLIVWMPPAKFTAAQLKNISREIEKLGQSKGVKLVSNPTAELATHYLFHDGTNWILKTPGNEAITVGETLTTEAVLAALKSGGGEVKLFVSLPPSSELATKMKSSLGTGTSNSAVGWAKTQADADYLLIGRARTDAATTTLEYAWLLPKPRLELPKQEIPTTLC